MRKFSQSLILSAVFVTGLTGLAVTTIANEGAHVEHQHWGFKSMFGKYDRPAMQRGYQVYREVCASCHALEHLAFRHLGDKGAPFYDPDYKNPNDNPVIKQLAKDWEVEDIDTDTGDAITRPAIPADYFPRVYPNEYAAAASNGGGVPPDLSLIISAREGGADHVYGILTGFDLEKEAPEGTYYNKAFPAPGFMKMAPPLADGSVEYMDGTEASLDQMARDVTEFLSWAADPKMEVRKKTGFATLIYLFLLSILLFMTYKQVWKGQEH